MDTSKETHIFIVELIVQKALRYREFIKKNLIHNKWHWSVCADGTVNTDDKAVFGKCLYHNGCMYIEIMERFSAWNL